MVTDDSDVYDCSPSSEKEVLRELSSRLTMGSCRTGGGGIATSVGVTM
jgi:hypothetical protein